jgi:[ribosomal protein S5]-alanine N-acetyltransferase
MHFTLRSWEKSDLTNLVRFANNNNVAKFMNDSFPHPYTTDAGKSFIEFANKESIANIFAIDINGEAIGGIGIHPKKDVEQKNAELGYWLAEPFWGNSIITNAVIEIVKYGFENFDINRIFARPFGTNIGSQKVLEKAGFILEARFKNTFFKNGEFFDELIYAIRR